MLYIYMYIYIKYPKGVVYRALGALHVLTLYNNKQVTGIPMAFYYMAAAVKKPYHRHL